MPVTDCAVRNLGCTLLGLLAWAAGLAGPAHGEPRTTLADAPVGRIEFTSYTPANQTPFLARKHLEGPAVVVHGELSLPASSPLQRANRLPAVILGHGSGGISEEREHAWAERLRSWGIAAFILDSYSGRGIKPPTYANQARTPHSVAHVLDSYRALQLLATHPRLDGRRIALMGFSRGGETAVNAIFEPFAKAAVGDATGRFAAYVPFYPYCSFRHASKALATAPMLMLLGGADEQTGFVPCQNMGRWLQERGFPVKVVTYPNAHHGFDRLGPVRFDPAFIGIIRCEAVFDLDTREVRRLDTGASIAGKAADDAWVRECRHKGAHFGGNETARNAAIAEVRRFLTDALKP